jgi:hypothetical protein
MNISWVLRFNRGRMTTTGHLNGHQMVVSQTASGFDWRTCGKQGSAPDIESAQRAAIETVLEKQ